VSGGTARHRRLGGDRQRDSERATIAASLQMTCPRWLIMWSRWHQTYTAFACFTREPVIVDEAMVDAFLARIQQVERDSREPFGRV
jgi:hypothetical protein